MNVLITGSTGYLGSHLVTKLKSLNYNIFISNTKIANLFVNESLHIYNNIKFDYIFHLAALTKIGSPGHNCNGSQWLKNSIISVNVLNYWRLHQKQAKLICIGSSSCYAPDMNMVENNYLIGKPEKRFLGYSNSKRELLRGLQMIAEEDDLKWLYVIPSTVYGPDFQLSDNRYIIDIIRKCHYAKTTNSDFTIWGTGEQERELLYIDDAIDILLKLKDINNEVVNLSNGLTYEINFIVKSVCKLFDYDFSKVKRDLTVPPGMKKKNISNKKLMKILGSFEFTNLDKGLKNTIEYYKTKIR